MSAPVLAATAWNTNSDLIADCARLGYLRPEWRTLDPTYGRGNWWNKWRPDELITHDLATDGVDFRALPEPDASFDAVAFDPPYVCIGGRTTSGIPEFHDRFGLIEAPRSPKGLQEMIDDGLAEMVRVLRPKGTLLVKCTDYVSSGKLWIGTHHTLSTALGLGLELWDRLEMVAAQRRPQPTMRNGKPVVQQHAGRNLSTLFVFRNLRKAEDERNEGTLFDPLGAPARPCETVETGGMV